MSVTNQGYRAAEALTDDPLNAPQEGGIRDIRSKFWGDVFMNSARLEPLSKAVRVLSVLETYLGEPRDPCVTAYENTRGGRVVVFGHSPWRYVDVKREPILNAADWAMGGMLPVRIREAVPLIPIVCLPDLPTPRIPAGRDALDGCGAVCCRCRDAGVLRLEGCCEHLGLATTRIVRCLAGAGGDGGQKLAWPTEGVTA